MSGRIRSIKPEWLEDEKIAACTDEARLLSVALLLVADDHGNGRAHPQFLAGQVWAYSRDPQETLAKVSRAIHELVVAGFIALYEVGGQNYFTIRNWARHQRVDHAGKPRVPGPADGSPVVIRETLGRVSRETRESLAPDLRPPTSDLRPPREDQKYVGCASPTPGGVDVGQALPEEAPAKIASEVLDSRPPDASPDPDSAEARTLPLFDGASVPVTTKKPTPAKVASEVLDRVFAVYLAARTKAGRRGKPPQRTTKDRTLVTARLAEGFSEEQLCAAARGIWIDDGLRKEGHREFFHAMRDTNIASLGILDASARASPTAAPPLAKVDDLEKPVGPLPAQFTALCG